MIDDFGKSMFAFFNLTDSKIKYFHKSFYSFAASLISKKKEYTPSKKFF